MQEANITDVYANVEKALAEDQLDVAERWLFPAMDQHPKDPQLLFYASHCLVKRDHYALAKLAAEESLRLSPNSRAYGNLGAVYRRMNDNVMAEKMLRKAIDYEPGEKNAWNNFAANYVNEGNPLPGIEAAKKALEIDPDFTKAKWNLGLLQLEAGQFKEGWENYRVGLALSDRMLRSYTDGTGGEPKLVESLDELVEWREQNGRKPRVITWGEQGLGDEIMFSTILKEFSEYADIVFECHPRLIKIFQDSYKFVKEFHPTRKDDMLEWPAEVKPCQFKLPIGDLGMFFRPDRESFNIKDRVPLKPDGNLKAMYRRTLEDMYPGKKFIGVAWTGGVLRTMRWYRSCELQELWPLGYNDDVVLVSLQYEDDAAAVDRYAKFVGNNIHRFPAITQHYDYQHTLALVCALDEVVTVCQSVAHLSAAAGVKTTVLVPDKPAWRYGLEEKDWFWYGDNARLYRRNGPKWDFTQLWLDMGCGPMPAHEQALLKGAYREGDRMLELGCKQGDRYKKWFQAQGVEHVSVDLNGKGGALKLDLQEPLPSSLGEFDIVTNFGTTEHVEQQWPVWNNIHNALRKGGTLISTTPFPGDWKHHGRWYPTLEWYREFCERNGYEIQEIGVVNERPRRMTVLKAVKVEDDPFCMPLTKIYENDTGQKVGAYG